MYNVSLYICYVLKYYNVLQSVVVYVHTYNIRVCDARRQCTLYIVYIVYIVRIIRMYTLYTKYVVQLYISIHKST